MAYVSPSSLEPQPSAAAKVSFDDIPVISTLRNATLAERIQARLDAQARPPGSLGRLEKLAVHVGLILGVDTPRLHEPTMMLCAGDHGLLAQGVSSWPSDVTTLMMHSILAGDSTVSVLVRQHGMQMKVIDCGVVKPLPPQPGLHLCSLGRGTADATQQPAMTMKQCRQGIRNGRELVAQTPGNVVLLGEMGIGNTSPSSLLLARLAGLPIEAVVGTGAGMDEAGRQRKLDALTRALDRHASATTPLEALAALGGFEIATMVGIIMQAALENRVIIVDGFITTAAVLVASRLSPAVLERCIFAHESAEPGHRLMLAALGAEPLLQFGMRLGEGSAAALVWPLVESACRLLNEVVALDQLMALSPAIMMDSAKAVGHRRSK
ncbi:MAG: nicotinate-nucleotide--dimethylbenzimidazole phosphoribosyltransferase [Lautropia sp.]|nr:nicotinate-nucleotide--dimethylbenzimidazole phosphoribosyltransferase [Lautropia sp.]